MSLHALFQDAHRRVCIRKQRGEALDLDTLWAGLAFPSQMRGKAQQFFRPLNGDETPRVLGWYLFTEKGKAEYLRRYENAPDYFENPDYFPPSPDFFPV